MTRFSTRAASLWAKKSRKEEISWLPLLLHMSDSAGVAQELWRSWLSEGIKHTICNSLVWQEEENRDFETRLEKTRRAFLFLSAAHDLGKATPVFQAKSSTSLSLSSIDLLLMGKIDRAGLPMPDKFPNASKSPHALASQLLLQDFGCDPDMAAILGAHHGKPANSLMLINNAIESYIRNYFTSNAGRPIWNAVQNEVLGYALHLSNITSLCDLPRPGMTAQVLLAGLIIIVDWIASNEVCFPYVSVDADVRDLFSSRALQDRVGVGWSRLDLPRSWSAEGGLKGVSLFTQRFSGEGDDEFKPHLMQVETAQIARDTVEPGILIIEAPMGQGKTEAALVAAEIFANKAGCSGVFFALPTQATSDGMFSRIRAWASQLDPDNLHSIRLSHGKAQFNPEYLGMLEGGSNVGLDDEDPLAVHPWFEGNKKSLLADFVVGTVDQLLMAALRQKHAMLRHVGLANKVVVIDECHAYDAYMNQYLERALNWLGAYRVPVVLLSATLPSSSRLSLVDAYFNRRAADISLLKEESWRHYTGYPLLTWSDGDVVECRSVQPEGAPVRVEIGCIQPENISEYLNKQLKDGGCAGLLFNTVKRAQEMARTLRERFGDAVVLLHSRFIAPDRTEKEVRLLEELGKPDRGYKRPSLRIVVGTQVLEQSLDIDFDLMITDLCPMDLLLQRIGRLHRHQRRRPISLEQARCLVVEGDDKRFDEGSEYVYGRYLLMRTKAFLPQDGIISLPEDIPKLVQAVYDETLQMPEEFSGYGQAKADWDRHVRDQKERAIKFRVRSAIESKGIGLDSWLDLAPGDSARAGEATVRDTDESIEVLLVQCRNGGVHFLPWQEEGRKIRIDAPLSEKDARALAKQRIRLPAILCKPFAIKATIDELEQNARLYRFWQESPWLKGELAMFLDESGIALLNGYRIHYDRLEGMTYEKEEG